MRASLQQYIWLDSLCELWTAALHRQLGINNTFALGYSPEKHFYPNDSDNLLNQKSHFISLVICLHAWRQLWPTFLHIVAVNKNLLTIMATMSHSCGVMRSHWFWEGGCQKSDFLVADWSKLSTCPWQWMLEQWTCPSCQRLLVLRGIYDQLWVSRKKGNETWETERAAGRMENRGESR